MQPLPLKATATKAMPGVTKHGGQAGVCTVGRNAAIEKLAGSGRLAMAGEGNGDQQQRESVDLTSR